MRKSFSPCWLLLILAGLNLSNYLGGFVLNAFRTPIADDLSLYYGFSRRMVFFLSTGLVNTLTRRSCL